MTKKSSEFTTKDSGSRKEYPSGMHRDLQDGKPDFSLLISGVGFDNEMLTRYAALLTRGADKYGRRNWQLASTEEELERFKASAFRHFMQWITGEDDEDHAAATWFNINAYEVTALKIENDGKSKE